MELIDVRKVIEKKSPRLAARIPRFVTNWLSRLIHQEELNELLIYGDGLSNVEFITAVLDKLEIGRDIIGVDVNDIALERCREKIDFEHESATSNSK